MKSRDEAPDGRMLLGSVVGLGLLTAGCSEGVPDFWRNTAMTVLVVWLAALWFRG